MIRPIAIGHYLHVSEHGDARVYCPLREGWCVACEDSQGWQVVNGERLTAPGRYPIKVVTARRGEPMLVEVEL